MILQRAADYLSHPKLLRRFSRPFVSTGALASARQGYQASMERLHSLVIYSAEESHEQQAIEEIRTGTFPSV
jgi:hypothetical protein